MCAHNTSTALGQQQRALAWLRCALIVRVISLAMTVALTVAVTGAGTGAAFAQPAASPHNAFDFDHEVHSQKNQLSGHTEIACAACHALRGGLVRTRPDHAACFGSCHGAAPTRSNGTSRLAADPKLCGACHQAAPPGVSINFRTRVAAAAADRDFGLALSHQAHSSATCESCHRRVGPPSAASRTSAAKAKTIPHVRCIQCHGTSSVAQGFAITECTRCHTAAFGPESTPVLAHGLLAVTKAFSHQQPVHRNAPCTTCHRAVASSKSDVLDPPTMVSCGTSNCHDGKTGFATTQACTRCHQEAPQRTFTVARPTKRYDHVQHNTFERRDGTSATPCTGCHRNGNNEPTPPQHDACTACHASDFAAPAPVICGACHQSTEPWRILAADQRPLPLSQFGARLDHRSHVAACTTCHTLTTTTTELRPARGHSSCSTCHRDQVAPKLTDCAGCHQLNLANQRNLQRLRAAWSTRAQFDHSAHGRAIQVD